MEKKGRRELMKERGDKMVRRSFFRRNKKNPSSNQKENFTIKLGNDLEKNLSNVKNMLDDAEDLIIRHFTSGSHQIAIVCMEGLVDKEFIQTHVIRNLQGMNNDFPDPAQTLSIFYQKMISLTSIKYAQSLDDISYGLLSGNTVLYLNGIDQVLILGTSGGKTREIQEPVSESLIRGPRDGFVEDIQTNISLLRRYIRDPNLRFKSHEIGRRSKQKLVVAFMDGITDQDLVKEVNRRLETIDIDFAPESGFVEQWIEDSFLSPFPQFMNTERPDKVSAALMQGKIAILLNGTPFVLTAPTTLGDTLQSPEDYYERWSVSSLIRILRYLGVFISMFLPAFYIALVSYHQGMIPTKLAFSIAATREGVPFPSFVEAVLMGITMELLREAGARLPQSIGQTIGIVGGLVIGDAAVRAGIVSPIMVIVVALTAISSFTYPAYSIAIAFRMLRFAFMIAAALLGLYGIILLYIAIMIHIANLKSIGVPYSAPFSPTFIDDWKDLVIRAPITLLKNRPVTTQTRDKVRIKKENS